MVRFKASASRKGAHDLLAEYARNAFRTISCITLPQPTPSHVSAKIKRLRKMRAPFW